MELHGFFGSYVRDLGWDWRSPDEYIARLESHGLSHHVVLLVVFDPTTIEDTATYEYPHRFPRGIDYVLVGGQIAVDHGLVTSARAGKALRRP